METLTKFEKARIIGARALQISMGAPLFIKIPKGVYSTIELAKKELAKGVLPMAIKGSS